MTTDYGLQIFDRTKLKWSLSDEDTWITGVQGCNCAFRRSALAQIGGFDEQFSYYLDETDVCLRLARAGYTTLHLSANPVRHYPARAAQANSMGTRPWQAIARSDTYFALKNGTHAWPRRLATTLALAPRKHFVQEGLAYALGGGPRLKVLARLGRGYVGGLWAGLFEARRFADLTPAPPAYIPFEPIAPEHPLRIALLSQEAPVQAKYGGIARYTYDLALGLYERGHEVHLFCKDTQTLRHHGLGFFIHGVFPENNRLKAQVGADVDRPVLNKNVRHALAIVDQLRTLYADDIEFDVVHAPNWDAEGAALIRAQVYPITLVLATPLAQSIVAEQWPLTADLRACVALDRWQIEHADAVCTPSAGVWKSYTALMGMLPQAMEAWRVVPQGIVPETASPQPASARHSLLFVGRLERRKGVHTLLEVLPALLRDAPDWECHLVGNDQIPLAEGGTLRERFLALHAGAPWLKRVFFHGTVGEDQLRRHYQQCDLFVAPSLFESYGLIYHEAMQYGKAVVGCRVGGVPEVVSDGVDGRLVPPDSPAELQTALAELMHDDARRAQMGQAGARHVHEQVNYRTMAAGMEQAYYAIIDAVGNARRERRRRLWPRALPLLAPCDQLQLAGAWRQRIASNEDPYLMGEPGAILTTTARAPVRLQLVVLRHGWSGVLEVSAGDGQRRYLDLYQPEDRPPDYQFQYQLEFQGERGSPIAVTVRVLGERNPASRGCEVWLKQVAITEEAADV